MPRNPRRDLERAGTQVGRGTNGLVVGSLVAILAGVLVIVAALLLTQGQSGVKNPTVVTPAGVPWNGTTLGSTEAPATLDLWSDYQCPNCKTFALNTEPALVDRYVGSGQLKIVYHDLLVIDAGTGGTESMDAANAARCAGDLGKYWLMHDWLFANQGSEGGGAFVKSKLLDIGRAAGLDMARLQPCIEAGTHNAETKAETPPSGIGGTPGILVNGKQVVSSAGAHYVPSLKEIEAAIDAALQAHASGGQTASPARPSVSSSPAS